MAIWFSEDEIELAESLADEGIVMNAPHKTWTQAFAAHLATIVNDRNGND